MRSRLQAIPLDELVGDTQPGGLCAIAWQPPHALRRRVIDAGRHEMAIASRLAGRFHRRLDQLGEFRRPDVLWHEATRGSPW